MRNISYIKMLIAMHQRSHAVNARKAMECLAALAVAGEGRLVLRDRIQAEKWAREWQKIAARQYTAITALREELALAE